MNLIYYIVGVGLIFFIKLFVNNKNDEAAEKFKRIFEIPADVTMLSFMMGVAGTTSIDDYGRSSQIILLLIILISVISVALYKECCYTISSKGGITQFDKPNKAIALFLINSILSLSTAFVSYNFLGANNS